MCQLLLFPALEDPQASEKIDALFAHNTTQVSMLRGEYFYNAFTA